MTQEASHISPTLLKESLLTEASKFNQIFVWPFLPIFLIASALEYFMVPEHWDLLFFTRLGVIGIGGLCIALYFKKVINSYWMMGGMLTVMGLHCSFFFLVCKPEFLLQLNLAYFVYFASMGAFALFNLPHRLLSIGGTLVSGLAFIALNESISFEQWIFNGGVIILLGAPISYLLARSRMDFLRRDTLANLQNDLSQKLLNQKNQSLEKAKAELEEYNLKLESEVAKRTKSLLRSNQERDAMVYRLSHDFKSPMVNIRSLVLLAQEEPDPQKQSVLFEMIEKSIRKFEGLVGSMDQFVIYALEETALETLSLPNMINTIWVNLQDQFPSKMELEMAPGLPESILSSSSKLEMVFRTLLKNAIQYRLPEGQPRVTISSQQMDGFSHILIQDNGKGIPDSLLEKVTDLFFRGDTSSEGLGVGLYLAKGCMEQLGGRLTIQSVSKGTSIELVIPNNHEA